MTKIKLCGIKRTEDIAFANEIEPSHIGFVFAPKSRRFVTKHEAQQLRKALKNSIIPVGVFVNEELENIIELLNDGVIAAVQLHGSENNDFIERLRKHSDCTIIKAFCIKSIDDVLSANSSHADMILLDSGEGSGKPFDHSLIKNITRPYFLAGGLNAENVQYAIEKLHPYGVDASSSLETDGFKDKEKMSAFTEAVRKADKNNE